MKITIGLGSIDNYIPYLKAGADEFFCGYVPYSRTNEHGLFSPLNRREVMYYNVQVGSASEMRILKKMVDQYHIPVVLTLNSPFYAPSEYPELLRYLEHCVDLGFSSFIVADYDFLQYLHSQSIVSRLTLHLSGESGEINRALLPLIRKLHIDRVIFHRKVDPAEMKSIKDAAFAGLSFEAFAMNERCHFHGGFCNSLHCDELCHMCLVPYRLGPVTDAATVPIPSHVVGAAGSDPNLSDSNLSGSNLSDSNLPDSFLPGSTGCALCALWQLREAGVDWLKVVSRGARQEETLLELAALKKALRILNTSESEESYVISMKKAIFPSGCSKQCYYQSCHKSVTKKVSAAQVNTE